MERLLARNAVVKAGDIVANRLVLGEPFLAKDGGRNRPHAVCACQFCNRKDVICLHRTRQRLCACVLQKNSETRSARPRKQYVRPPLYAVWLTMRQRCSNERAVGFKNYGARGISVCTEWSVYLPFEAWAMANGYEKGLDIDRINNDGNYDPGNCRFVTRRVNARNRRVTRLLTAAGETKCVTDWSADERVSVGEAGIRMRLTLGWSVEEALFLPKQGACVESKRN